MSFKAQLSVDEPIFFNTDEFADSCTYKPFSGTEVENVPVVINSQGEGLTEYGHAFTAIAVLPTSAIANPKRNDELIINGLPYRVTSVLDNDAVMWTLAVETLERHRP